MAADGEWVLDHLRRHERSLLQYVGRLLGDSERAQDVVQEAFLKLCRQQRAEIEPRLPAWLFTVCRNQVRDLQRKENRMTVATPTDLDGRPSAAIDPASAAVRRETDRRVSEVLKELPDRSQEVVRLKFQHEMSYKQIAEITGLTVGNVGFILHHALVKLRTLLDSPSVAAS